MGDYFVLAISCIFINNILLIQYLGNCPFLGTSKKMETAVGMSMAVVFVLVMAGVITWITETYVLKRFGLEYLRTIAFILVIASLVQFVETFLKKSIPALYAGLGIFLPLITTNCAILGFALFSTNRGYGFFEGLFYAWGAGLGLTLALVLMASIRENTELVNVADVAKGTALVFIIAGCLSLAFMGFAGLLSSA